MDNNLLLTEGRFKKSTRNIVFSLLSQIIIVLFEALARRFFLQVFTSEYLGLGSVFKSILNILSFADLGIGSAIVFSLYKPIAENNQAKIRSYMRVYRNTFLIIGTIVLICGAALTPFLNIFVKEMPDIPHIRLIYLLFVFQSGIQYFFSYKITFLTANQQNYIFQRMQIIASFVKLGLQITSILLLKNYFMYLGSTILVVAVLDVACSIYVNKKYPFVKGKAEKLEKKEIDCLKKNVFALFLYRVGNTLLVTIDTIVISKMLGVVPAAIYSNYHLIITYSDTFFVSVLGTITPSLGNFMVGANTTNKRELFKRIQNIYSWIATLIGVGMIVCLNPFVSLWLGNEYLLDQSIVVMLVISLSLTNFQRPCSLIRDTNGLFWCGKFRPLIMAIINIVASVILTYFFGMIGVVIGTIIAKLSTFVWYDPYIVYKHVFLNGLAEYFYEYIEKWIVFLLLTITCVALCNRLPFTGWLAFFAKVTIVMIVVNLVYLNIFKKSGDYNYLKNHLFNIFKKTKS